MTPQERLSIYQRALKDYERKAPHTHSGFCHYFKCVHELEIYNTGDIRTILPELYTQKPIKYSTFWFPLGPVPERINCLNGAIAIIESEIESLTPNFSRLGLTQKHIIRKIVADDYYIVKSYDRYYDSTTISLVDDAGNYERDLSQSQLDALIKRGFLVREDEWLTVDLLQERYSLNEKFSQQALNAAFS